MGTGKEHLGLAAVVVTVGIRTAGQALNMEHAEDAQEREPEAHIVEPLVAEIRPQVALPPGKALFFQPARDDTSPIVQINHQLRRNYLAPLIAA